MVTLSEVKKLIEKKKGLTYRQIKGGISVIGKRTIYLRTDRESSGIIASERVGDAWDYRPITNRQRLEEELRAIQPFFPRGLQRKTLSFLALKGPSTLAEVAAGLDMTATQVGLMKKVLIDKERIVFEKDKMRLVGKFAFKPEGKDFAHIPCSHLTNKQGRKCFCPIKKHFIDERHYKDMCGCYFCPDPDGAYHEPVCVGWMRQ